MKHLYLILISTFIVGFATGVYAYVLVREPVDVTQANDDENARVITADEYGGCELTSCISYRILEDGTYTFIERRRGSEEMRSTGALSDARTEQLFSAIDEAELARVRESTFADTCPAAVDGVAYRFGIRVSGSQYSFDSCSQEIPTRGFFGLLIDQFDIFRSEQRG